MAPLKVMTILGTRPEIIRLSRVIARLDASEVVDHVLVHTGQNHDYALDRVFFEDLELREPDEYLNVAEESLGRTLGRILVRSEEVFRAHDPDAVLILGDTNSALAAVIARRMKIPVYHMEAGNRSFDRNVPEETNRRIVDHVADFNLAYTEHARRHLLSEGLEHRRVYVTGSPMAEVLDTHRGRIDRSTVLDELGLEEERYVVASVHREENVDRRDRLLAVTAMLEAIVRTFDMPVVLSLHPRTRKRLDQLGGAARLDERIHVAEPFGYFDYNRLQSRSFCTVSDSGTVAEEATILGFPAVTPRDSIERPEAMDTGGIVVTGLATEDVVRGIRLVTSRARADTRTIPEDYRITNVSGRVLALIVGTARLSNRWDGIRMNDLG